MQLLSELSHRPPRMHTVKWGETLATISVKYYGSALYAGEIWNMNRHVLASPNNLQPYSTICIPYLPFEMEGVLSHD